jgi:hypothetical protein
VKIRDLAKAELFMTSKNTQDVQCCVHTVEKAMEYRGIARAKRCAAAGQIPEYPCTIILDNGQQKSGEDIDQSTSSATRLSSRARKIRSSF